MDTITIMKRLALAKYIYEGALRQTVRQEPFNGISVLGFHDAVDMLLG